MGTRFVSDRQIYAEVVQGLAPRAKESLWIATADIKDMHVDDGGEMVPFLKVLARLGRQGVQLRLLHAKEPGPNFRRDFDRYPSLLKNLERILCPRVHFKSVIVDGRSAYAGSANLTGAGLGAKTDRRRNFEHGFVTDDPELVRPIVAQFTDVWAGAHCADCGRKEHCAAWQDRT